MKNRFFLLLGMSSLIGLGFLAQPAMAKLSLCAERLSKTPANIEVNETLSLLRSYGLTSLLSEFDMGKIEVSRRQKIWPWQAAVGTRVTWTGRKILIIRELDRSTEHARQKSLWQIAEALFELQAQNPLPYFTYELPSKWREQRLSKMQALIRELYVLFISLPELEAKDFMARRDSRSFVPNVEDFEVLKSQGVKKLGGALDARHSRALLFNYYFTHVKRMMMASSIVMTVALVPHMTEIPSLLEAEQSRAEFSMNQQMAPANIHELKRLLTEIKIQEKLTAPDEVLIASLKQELQALSEKFPWLVYEQRSVTNEPNP